MKKFTLILFIIITTFTSCMEDVSGIENITVEDLKSVIERDKGVQILDVRLPSEHKSGTILNAMKINLISNDFKTKAVDMLDKEKPVYVYCRSGNRSKVASKILLDKGYKVYNVKGGYKAWIGDKPAE